MQLDILNEQQKKAVTAPPGPVLVLAGPGSGKTRVLTHRAAYLIGELRVNPIQLMAVTFTNKAASEMGERVNDLLRHQTRGITLGTFHSICARFLRSEADNLPVSSNYVIFDADDQIKVVKQIVQDFQLDDKKFRPRSIHNAISAAKNELIFPEDYPIEEYRDEVYSRVYDQYQKILISSNALDFDDLLLWMAYLLAENDLIREKYARRFQHILVDEFQDTNMAQYTLLKNLASGSRNIFVVGDSDQSIYRWRGADYRNVMRFEKDFPEAQVILLEQNYRSTQNILDTAMSVIDRNEHRTPKELFTERGAGKKILIEEFLDERDQAEFIVKQIRRQVSTRQASPEDFAVMYRTNAQSRILEEAFLYANLPYKLVGAQRFYGRKEVKDMIAYLRLIANPDDRFSLSRIISTPPRGIGAKTFASLVTQAQRSGISPGAYLINMGGPEATENENFSSRAAGVLRQFGILLRSWREKYETLPPVEVIDLVLSDIGFQSYLEDGSDEGADRWENVEELRRLAAEYQTIGLNEFLEKIALVSDQDTLDTDLGAPTLLTLHAAKGLEFSQVFIIGLNDGLIPHQRSFDDPESMEEERRLFYVGITRAKDRLYLLHSLQRFSRGYMEPQDPSRYYRDIPPEVRDQTFDTSEGMGAGNYHGLSSPQSWREIDESRSETEKQEREYIPGMKVKHSKWGVGVIINSKLDQDDEIVDIFFEAVGKSRKVLASLADLEVIKK
jgi:DNA helicase-2/ATP-dependent DNA helicase PcrA